MIVGQLVRTLSRDCSWQKRNLIFRPPRSQERVWATSRPSAVTGRLVGAPMNGRRLSAIAAAILEIARGAGQHCIAPIGHPLRAERGRLRA